MRRILLSALLLCVTMLAHAAPANQGYYRYPTIHGDTIVFTSQGDLWKVSVKGGQAQALTTHPGEETNPAISPDGRQIAFTATYEGAPEIYVMPIEGGLPTRLTYEGLGATVVGWTPDGKVLYASAAHSTLPDDRLTAVDPKTLLRTTIPLAQASDGCYDTSGKTLFFTRLPFQGSHTKRYQGGTAQNLWKFSEGMPEAVPLTKNYPGTSKTPMWWKDRVYFVSDRDGTMNLWVMDANGGNLKQLTKHSGFDVQSPSLDNGRIVYQLGADLHLYDIAANKDLALDISVSSDFDQTREKWINNPLSYLSSVSFAADGSKVALTARGRVFVAPTEQGRFVEVTRKQGARYRNGLFTPDGKTLLVLSDESGENEWWSFPANGVGAGQQFTRDSKVVRLNGIVSPDGKRLVYTDKNQDLWLLTLDDRKTIKIATSAYGDFDDLRWSPDSQWLAYTSPSATFSRIVLYSVKTGQTTPITTERADSGSPAWSPDGKWLYFLSDRTFRSLVGSPWGPRQPEPFFDKQSKIYLLALTKGQRSPFQPADELTKNAAPAKPMTGTPTVEIALDGIQKRLWEVPIPSGNYSDLKVNGSRLFFVSRETSFERKSSLMLLDIKNTDIAPKPITDGISGYDLSADGKKLLVRKGNDFFTLDASTGPSANLDKKVDLSSWTFAIVPREEWREMFTDAWRLERDYFYDPKLHSVDWEAIRKRYQPLVERVRDRDELSDLIAQVVGELSALHIFVYGGDARRGQDNVATASLGADWTRDEAQGGYRIQRIYSGDPDYPGSLAPLSKPGADVNVGDTIQAINGVETLSIPDPAILLRNSVGKQTLLRVREANGTIRECIVTPISSGQAYGLRYMDWELSRRQTVEEQGKGALGYVHLRAMGGGDMAQWEKDYYPVFDRQGLIIDVRHNNGGNIDSWILSRLLRKAWFYWQPRVGMPYWNMQGAFRGHLVVLCDEFTASDGEAFTEGFKRLKLGKVIGTRTWGGEIWLSSDNNLVDTGIATAAEYGVYGPEGKWLIEGHGVDPDIIVDNLPHATFMGEDAQLKAAIAYLQEQIRLHPVPVPPAPPHPDKSYPGNALNAKRQ